MKTRITVMWSRSVEIDVDPDKINDDNYVVVIQAKAVGLASRDLDWKEGMVTDCEDFPQFIE